MTKQVYLKMNWWKNNLLTCYRTFLVLNIFIGSSLSLHRWERAGCHRVGHSRSVQIPGCVEFNVTTTACRGFCLSYAIPSPSRTLLTNPLHQVTSRAECCSIEATHDVVVAVRCIDGVREVTFKSATTCACNLCRRNW
ncbi:thyrostimulin alpha-2 subunit-like [Mytilus edulis]|uniref:thyrostimulin alpha-2 subunit-like n=1 Tax=Mytilus edulis TaxID=6550 RepID=UPI0039F11C3A